MTEAVWLTATDPTPILEFLRGKVSDRKLRLFSVASCRRVGHLFVDPVFYQAVDVGEVYADGGTSDEERQAAMEAAEAVFAGRWMGVLHSETIQTNVFSEMEAASAAIHAVYPQDCFVGSDAELPYLTWLPVSAIKYELRAGIRDSEQAALKERAEKAVHGLLLHDIIGNPFRSIALDPSWLSPTAVALARQIYESRDFTAMPILADALQDAGCENADILNHCRGGGVHVRGCWIVDRLLGKE
jgi:hypothetical protein